MEKRPPAPVWSDPARAVSQPAWQLEAINGPGPLFHLL
jgi:hypothetical protein